MYFLWNAGMFFFYLFCFVLFCFSSWFLFHLQRVAFKNNYQKIIYLQNLLRTLAEFIWTVQCSPQPQNITFYFSNILLLSVENMFFYNFNQVSLVGLHDAHSVWGGCMYKGAWVGQLRVMWSDAAPPASPSGKCRWACPRSAWRRTDAPDTWGRWSAEPGGGAAVWQTCKSQERLFLFIHFHQPIYTQWPLYDVFVT